MFLLNNDIVYVKGALRGALYNFRTGKVYSVNPRACEIIERYIGGELIYDDREHSYIDMLRKNSLISAEFAPRRFNPSLDWDIKLNMAWIEITQSCNLKCLHCYEGSSHKVSSNALTLDEWRNIIDQLGQQGISRLIIIGGEPCLNPNIVPIINHATKYPADITLFTNGTCFSEEIFNAVISNRIGVKISLYGHCAEIHDAVTGVKGSFDKMSRTVKILTENNISVSSAIIIMKENERYVKDIQDFARSSGMKGTRYDVIREVFLGTQGEHIPSDIEVIGNVYRLRPNFRADRNIFISNINKNSCFYGKISIQDNGNVIPCEFERSYIYGNVRENSISEILQNEKTKSLWFMDFGNVETCQECEYRFACHDCRPLGRATTGNMTSKNPRCMYNPYTGKWDSLSPDSERHSTK